MTENDTCTGGSERSPGTECRGFCENSNQEPTPPIKDGLCADCRLTARLINEGFPVW